MMTTVNMSPPSNGSNNSISFNGRTYSSTSGIPIPVPDFDVAVLQANGWVLLSGVPSPNVKTVTDTSGISTPFDFQVMVNPPSSSSAIVPAVTGETFYTITAPPITGTGHVIGALGRLFNDSSTNNIPLGVGIEGKIDNMAVGSAMTTAVLVDANLGQNVGSINSLYGTYVDIVNNSGTISNLIGMGINVEGTAGSIPSLITVFIPTLTTPTGIGTLYGLFFNNNPSIASKFCILCLDAGAVISTMGPIVTANKTTTATFQLDTGTKTATAAAGTATLNKASGKIATEALTTAAGASYALSLTNSQVAAADTVFASVANGTNSAGDPVIGLVTPGAGFVTIIVNNRHASAALNGNLVISFASLKA
jgi:hypothetical protein